MSLIHSLHQNISCNRHPLICTGDTVLVAVSGGPDSLSLLHALHALQEELRFTLSAGHLDHGFRGEESAAEAQFVAEFCAARGIPCRIGRADVKALQKTRGVSKQQAAREARYAFLERAAREFGANKIATAHTQDDQVETILLNILRGTGLEGLKGIPVQRGPYIRPLLSVSRAETEAYCADHDLHPRRDPSNDSPDAGTRNRIRLQLLPMLAQDYHPHVREALLRLSEIAVRDQEYLQAEAEGMLPHLINDETLHKLALDRHGIAPLHPSMQRHVLRAAIARMRGTTEGITSDHLTALCDAIAGDIAACSVTLPAPKLVITLQRNTVSLSMPRPRLDPPLIAPKALTPPCQAIIDETGWQVGASWKEPEQESTHTAILDAGQVDTATLTARVWRPGDRMALLGMDGKSKKVQDIFTDAKVPSETRHTVPIIADQAGILWIAGIAVAERAKTTDETTSRLYLTASPQNHLSNRP